MSLYTDKAIKYVPRLQKDLGITRLQACGIFGNLGTETGGFTALQEIKPTVKGSRGGYGWMQWTGPRRRAYEAWCKAQALTPADDETNYKYLVQETKTAEANSLALLKKTATLEAATETFMSKNLRPGAPHLDSRIKYAKLAETATKASPIGDTVKKVAIPGTIIIGGASQVPSHWYDTLFNPQALMIGLALVAATIALGYYVLRRYRAYKAINAN